MRLETIKAVQAELSDTIQSLVATDISDQIVDQFRLFPHEPFRYKARRALAGTWLAVQQPRILSSLKFRLSFPCDLVANGERFANDASRGALLQMIRSQVIDRVLIPGCYLAAEDVQFWLRRGVRRLDGIDVYALEKRWQHIVPELRQYYSCEVNFQQATIEDLPFPDQSVDLIVSDAVLEHVRNLRAAIRETARILRPGGWAWHGVGPLYYTFGGDHCITAYGASAGYDHLLLDEPVYQARIGDQAVFDQMPDPNAPFWAKQQQFSFAIASDYITLFKECFDIRYVVVKISSEGLGYRQNHPGDWQRLINAGLTEEALLVKSLAIVLQKPKGDQSL